MKKNNNISIRQMVDKSTSVDSLTPLLIGLLIFATALIIIS